MMGWAARGAARVSVFGSFYGTQKNSRNPNLKKKTYLNIFEICILKLQLHLQCFSKCWENSNILHTVC